MKAIFYIILLCAVVTTGYAQRNGEQDTVVVITVDSTKKEEVSRKKVDLGFGKISVDTSRRRSSSKFAAQFTFARFDLGLSKYVDNNSFTLSPPNSFLENETWKTINVAFDLFQFQYRASPYFKMYLAAGFDWNHIRLKRDIDILPDEPRLTAADADVEYEKNRLSSTYLRIPLGFEFRTKDDQRGKKVYFVAGPEAAFLINGKLKQKSSERGKEKVKDDFNFNPFRYGAYARLGYGDFGIYTKYYFSDVFAKDQGPTDFKNLSFGFMVNF